MGIVDVFQLMGVLVIGVLIILSLSFFKNHQKAGNEVLETQNLFFFRSDG